MAYNVAHDNALAVLAVDYDAATPAEASIGIDIMRSTLPRGVTISGFVDIFNDQVHLASLSGDVSCSEHGL